MSSAATVPQRELLGGEMAAVLDAAAVGAPWALRALYETYAAAVLGYARAQGAEDPEGVVNDVFLRAFRRVDSFTGDAAGFRSWIFTIAHNLLIDDRRRRSRRVQYSDAHEHRGFDAQVRSAEDEVLHSDSQRRVVALLATLAPDQRDVLTLRLVADLTVPQIAAVTGRSPGAVKALQRRGLNRLRSQVGQGVPL